MTAYSKAQKLKAKRGRPVKDAAYRESNGRVSRAKEPADKVALEARARHLGLSVIEAKDQRAETFLGYLAILGGGDGISKSQYQGALKYLDLRSDYHQAIKSPNSMVQNGVKGASGDHITEAYTARCKSIVKHYDEVRGLLQDAQNADRSTNYWAALDLCVIRGERHDVLVGAVRCVCNVFVRFFGT